MAISPIIDPANPVEAKIREVFGARAEEALVIARCESGLNPEAKGDDYPINGLHLASYGIFQIRAFPGRGTVEQLRDYAYNIEYAYKMSGGGENWAPWYNCAKKYGLL